MEGAAAAGGQQEGRQAFTLDLPLQCGRTLRGATIAYETRGSLSPEKDNVILHPSSFDATSSDLMYQVGPGKLLDTNKYFVIVCNLLGNGFSTSPSNAVPPDDKGDWPLVTVCACPGPAPAAHPQPPLISDAPQTTTSGRRLDC